MDKKPKAKPIKLTLNEKQKVERIFEPLLSETFGGSNYHNFTLDEAKSVINDQVSNSLREQSLSDQVLRYISTNIAKINRSKSFFSLLEVISEICLLEEELTET